MKPYVAFTIFALLAMPACDSNVPLALSSDGGIDLTLAYTIIPKTAAYTGPQHDPGLNSMADCTDSALEPNDTLATAVPSLNQSLNLVIDTSSPKLEQLAICPKGTNPKANGHDTDFYTIEVPEDLFALVEITYDVSYGDLDVGIFDSTGKLVASDGSAVSNGCIASPLSAGTYDVGVVGANDADSNRYDLRIRYFSTQTACTTP